MILIECATCGRQNGLPQSPREWPAFLEREGWLRVGLLYYCPEHRATAEVLFGQNGRRR